MTPLRPVGTIREHALDSLDTFMFAVTGESRPPVPNHPWTRITRQIMWELSIIRPAFLLFTGDAFWGYDDSPAEMVEEIRAFRALADTTGIPVYNAPGNHEMQSEQAAVAALRQEGWDLYGSFDVGRYHFVCLNTDEWWKEKRVCGEQLEWLTADLGAHRDADGIFVFMHRPLFSWFAGDFNPDDAEALQALFRTHPVRAVFASHDHMYCLEERDGIRYYTTGGGGAPLYAQPPDGGFAHYLLVSVSPEGVDYNVVEPFHIEVDVLDDGRRARLVNTTDRDLTLCNVRLRGSRYERYRVAADFVDFARAPQPVTATVADVVDLGDSTVEVRSVVHVPTGTAFHVWLEDEAAGR